jgi:iron complex outermembrane receptor protein
MVPGYTRFDARLAWHPAEYVELSVVGQNLTNGRHLEFMTSGRVSSEARRSVYGKITWQF